MEVMGGYGRLLEVMGGYFSSKMLTTSVPK